MAVVGPYEPLGRSGAAAEFGRHRLFPRPEWIPEREGSQTSTGAGKDARFAVGVDISKAHLDAYRAPDGKAARFTNDAGGFKALIAWIERPVRAVTYEPTGHWHRAFEEALLTAKLPLARVNPVQARRFAQAIGQRAKTDVVDARVLAQMGAALDLRPTERTSPAWRALEELQVARDALIRDRTAALNRQKQTRQRLLK